MPAPTSWLWLVAVVASEWSLWLGALGLLGASLAPQTRAGRPAAALGLLAAAIALIPPLQTLSLARQNNVRLSLRRYLFGDRNAGAVRVRPNIAFAVVAGRTLRLDVYDAAGKIAPRSAAIIVVHGGSWRQGRKSDFAHWDRWLARQGFVVFDIEYRLAPQPNWHAATSDVKAAVVWLKKNAAHWSVDPRRIALLGRSAGGHLALLAAYTPAGDNERVAAVVSLYGPTDLVWGYNNTAFPDPINGRETLARFLGGTPQTTPAAYTAAAPINHVGPSAPPTLLIHGERDNLVGPQHARRLADRLRATGVPHQTLFIGYAQHGFDYNFSGWGSQVVQPVLLDFLRRASQ